MAELDLAFLSGNWQGINGRIEIALGEAGCYEGNWTPIITSFFGYSQPYLERSYRVLTCDPRRSISWMNTSRSALQSGDAVEALRVAREGVAIAPGNWLYAYLLRSLLANGDIDEAHRLVSRQFNDETTVILGESLTAAYEGDKEQAERLLERVRIDDVTGSYWSLMHTARAGRRDEANQIAAQMDQHEFGTTTLVQAVVWCDCGAPWDLEATPNFAAKIAAANLPWPPRQTMEFPLKDW